MIVIYILLGILLFFIVLSLLMIFAPLNMFIKGIYWDKKPVGQMDIYWIKYFLGVRIRIKTTEQFRLTIWFLGIPIPLTISIKDKLKSKTHTEKEEKKQENEKPDDPVMIHEESAKEKKDINETVRNIRDAREKIKDVWDKYKDYITKIFVSYVTFSLEFIDAELGLEDPAQTGMAAGIVYSALTLKPLDNIHVSWDYAKPNFNISAGLKMTMNLYGILCTLLHLYLRYKKDKRNEVQ